jgi:hypothetical protein
MGDVVAFPRHVADRATLHIMGSDAEGYEVWHESRSGDSWGIQEVGFRHHDDALAHAHHLNATKYGGECGVAGLATYDGGRAA